MTKKTLMLNESSVKKMPYSYRQQIRIKSCIDAVCEVSGLSLRDMKNKDHDYTGLELSFSKNMRNILIDMLVKSAWMSYIDVGDIVGLSVKTIEVINNSEKSKTHINIRKECFEKYCQLMFERTKPCLFSKQKSISVYKNLNEDGYELKEVFL